MKKEVKLGLIIIMIIIIAIIVIICSIKTLNHFRGLTPFEKNFPNNMNEINSIAENLLQALNNEDYPSFSRDFSQEMRLQLNEEFFSQTKQIVENTSGMYLSKEPSKFYEYDPYKIYQYNCYFQRENVTLTLYMNSSLIEGLYLDSENLRELLNEI